MTTTKQPTESTQPTPIRSSVVTTDVLLIAADDGYSSLPNTSDQSSESLLPQKRKYKPRNPYPVEKRTGKIITCPICGTQAYKPLAWLKKVRGTPTCGNVCRGIARSQNPVIRAHLKNISANGKGKKRPGKGLAGAANPAWRGGVTYFKTHGNYIGVKYVRCPAEYISMARKDGYVMEHRLLVAQALGRPLLRVEVVHHIDHNPANNDLNNLQLFASNRDHKLHEHHGSPAPIWQQ